MPLLTNQKRLLNSLPLFQTTGKQFMKLSEELQNLFRNLTRLTQNVRKAKQLLLSILDKEEKNFVFICSEFVQSKFIFVLMNGTLLFSRE